MGVESELESANEMRRSDPLAQRLADGDPKAPRELVERHHTELYRYARSLLRDDPTAEDAVQEAFERAFVALGKYPRERIETLSLRPWLYRIALNVVRNVWRDGRREVSVAETPEPGEYVALGAARQAAWAQRVRRSGVELHFWRGRQGGLAGHSRGSRAVVREAAGSRGAALHRGPALR